MNRHHPFCIALTTATLALAQASAGDAADVTKDDYTTTTAVYKRVGDLDVRADVYRPDDAVERAVVVWVHGGALINGHRASVPRNLRAYVEDRGFALVSIDYRLAPETKVPAILEDIEDAFRWVRGDGAKQFHLDPLRVAVAGGSAGGYLTLVTGYRVKPAPVALVAFWGYGDLVGEWYSSPSPHPRHNQVKVPRDVALRQVDGPIVSDSRDRDGNGGLFYNYCRQTGRWPLEVTGWDPHTEAERYVPYMPVRNVTPEYPPTLMVHGTADTDVPHEQSRMMAAEFKRHGVEHELISIEGGEHGLGGGDPVAITAAYEKAWAFLDAHLLMSGER